MGERRLSRVLLTGGTGFIGSHAVEHLLKNTEAEIVILDRLGYVGDTSRLTDIDVYDPSRVKVHWWDLRSPLSDTMIRQIGYVDTVINMASESHVDRAIEYPADFIANNVAVATTMLDYARLVKPEVFIQVSTDEVYGAAAPGHSHVEWEVIAPSNPYAASKAAQEAVAISYWRTYDVPLIITNTMNNFGERQHPEKFIPKSIRHIMNGEPVPVHSGRGPDGEWIAGQRVWLHARNHSDALMWLAQRPVHLFNGEPEDRPLRYNVGGETDMGNDEIVRRIAAVLGADDPVEYVDFHSSRPGHDLRYSLDSSKIHAEGWVAPMDFEESFTKAVHWMAEREEWLKP